MIRNITLGSTGITVPQNGFGALPIQRTNKDEAIEILKRAYQGGMKFFDTARAYSDSEEKVGEALSDVRENIYIASKSQAKNVEDLKKDLATSLEKLKTSYLDIYQFHCVDECYAPNDGSGMYEAMLAFKEQGLIKHIGITTHKIQVAKKIIASGLYETLQYPMSYLSTEQEIQLIYDCQKANMGFIAMKGLAGGLLTNSKACCAFITQFDNAVPIWGVQKMTELEQWLSFMENPCYMDDTIREFIEKDRNELAKDFCRGCGYCMPCSVDIQINQCARMSQMIRRAPSANWMNDYWQQEMAKIDNCIECGLCMSKCPYQLNTPELLKKNLLDYRKILSGETKI